MLDFEIDVSIIYWQLTPDNIDLTCLFDNNDTLFVKNEEPINFWRQKTSYREHKVVKQTPKTKH